MKIENEITGHVIIHTSSRLKIELWIKDEQIDFFMLDLEAEMIEIHLEKSTRVLLGMRQVYEGYIQLIKDLGLEIPDRNRIKLILKKENKQKHLLTCMRQNIKITGGDLIWLV